MIDPKNITNYNLTTPELEKHILFWVAAAGKNGHTAAKSLNILLKTIEGLLELDLSPFQSIKELEMLLDMDPYEPKEYPTLPGLLKQSGIGCYNHKAETMAQLAFSGLNLHTCSAEDLEKIYGIGMKTSRCFILHSRKNARYAGLDTHILKHLREAGVENVPKATPSSKKLYLTLEKEFLSLADKAGMSPAEYDIMIWRRYSVG